jgi:hypothetical protein
MTGVEKDGSGAVAKAGAAPVNSFRTLIETKLRVWRSLRQPTVQQIEWCQFWEEYLKKAEPEARAMQEPAGEPIQRR